MRHSNIVEHTFHLSSSPVVFSIFFKCMIWRVGVNALSADEPIMRTIVDTAFPVNAMANY